MDDAPEPLAATPAATLIIMRPTDAGPPDILVVERAARMAFAGGAIVFPGGRVEPADLDMANSLGRPDDACKIASIRETVEESAVLAGVRSISGAVDAAIGPLLQRALIDGADFANVLAGHGLILDLDALTPLARWIPAFKQARRFDTFFFVAAALPGDWTPVPQPGECQSARWTSARAVLDRIAAGTDHAIFPTKRNLERVARFASIEDARADAALHRINPVIPWVEQRDGQDHVCIPADIGYPVTSEPMTSAVRA